MIDPNKPLKDRIHAAEKQCTARYPEMSKAALEDWLGAIMVKPLPKIRYQQGLAETLFAAGYNENQVLEDDLSLIDPRDSDCDVEGKAIHLFHLSQACSRTPMVRLS